MVRLSRISVISLLTLILSLCLFAGMALAAEKIRVGATPVPHAQVLEIVKPILAEQGIELEIVEFTDYVQPNLALNDGDLDANFFQHIPYLEDFSASHRLDLTYIAKVHIEPMGAYSETIRSIQELKDGAVVAIPNDSVNGGRALLLLQAQGLLELDPAVGINATVFDITKNPKKLKIVELEAPQLPRVLPDVALAIINTNFALEAGLNPIIDALFIEDSNSPYVNIVAVRKGDENRPALKALAEALTSDVVRDFLITEYNGAVVPAF